MSEAPDKDSKTEEATEKKIRDAIEKGNVPNSREVALLGSLIGMLMCASLLLTDGVSTLKVHLERFVDDPGGVPLGNGADALQLLSVVGFQIAAFLTPLIIVLTLVGIFSAVLQNPPSLVANRIEPQWSRVSLKGGWERIFGLKGQFEFLKSVFKLSVVFILAVVFFQAGKFDVVNALQTESSVVPQLVLDLAIRLLATLAVATALLVAADLVWSRFVWHRDLRMTRQEVKDEHKQVDGDPLVKARMKSLARDRSRRRMMASVPRATLVIANPTHFAVALRYVREESSAPIVLAKGQDLIALKIRAIAEENGIPVVEDKELARALYKSVEVDRLIPPEFFKAVAEVILFLAAKRSAKPRLH